MFKLRIAETGYVTNDFKEQVFQRSSTLLVAAVMAGPIPAMHSSLQKKWTHGTNSSMTNPELKYSISRS
ncbi:hypothetical protein AC629_41565 [Bradyrhizobium sp. NAS80.1]|nr:hypothetical protein AC629_41565 [Bradyrhizobium sp. NAS80.1]